MTLEALAGYRALAESVGVCDLGPHGIVRVTGRDTWTFLQSLLSQDVGTLVPGAGAAALLLTPQGKLEVALRVLAVDGDAWLECEPDFSTGLLEGLRRFRIRVAVELDALDGARLAVRGPEVGDALEALGVTVPAEQHGHEPWPGAPSARVVRADWPTGSGVEIVGPPGAVAAARDELVAAGIPLVDIGAYEPRRIDAGVPRQGVDLDDKLIPQEAFLDLDAVSFTKGCFLGQELVCRIDTRGHVNRYLRVLDVGTAAAVPRGAEVMAADAVVGTVTSAAAVPGEPSGVALAMIRREVEPPAPVRLRWPNGESPATVRTR